ncbi:hypothetical protein BKA64DRAFT_400156 [Cadophora sp. MPI-SDFR-AT-0126]|nr:hypothetical protein BKA64DRAFT_400156 [Leotiomycetes sp. MPI-SDFR-AT-0126]
MLDPLTSISLASAVVQFVDFSVKLVSAGHELYEQGSLADNDEVEKITQDLANLTEELGADRPAPAQQLSQDEIAIKQLAGSCKELAEEMLAVLTTLKGQKPKSGLETVRKSLRSMRKKGKIQDIEKRLGKIRDELNLRLTAILSKKQSGVSILLKDLSDETKRYHSTSTERLEILHSQLLAILENQKKSHAKAEGLDAISAKCLSLAEEGKHVATAQKILRSLHFKTIKTRQVNVKEAHPKTFKWIFNDPDDHCKPQTRFREWMRSKSKNGIYWISGKAGSGKSTLMKFLIKQRVTTSLLESWSEGEKIVIASHFFWSSGNTMQKSQEGLLQSILFQILREYPDLIQPCCLDRWKLPDRYQDDPDPWTMEELSDCFVRLVEAPGAPKIFLLIDGLDEYDGEHVDLVHVLQRLNNSPRIKMCVSSRPWNVFEDAFGGNLEQKLRLHDFTRDDITRFVKDQLGADDRFKKLKSEDPEYLQLEKDIVDKAEGVFLWVFLVVRDLLRGLTDDNDIDFLKQRLDNLPAGLEEYFARILSTIEPVYREQTARIFQVMVYSAAALPAVYLWFLEIEKKDPDYALNEKPPFESAKQVNTTEIRMQKYVNARCKDLLEIHTPSRDDDKPPLSTEVDFLHRSVRDFLATKDMHDWLGSRTGSHFDARISLCKIHLAAIKTFCHIQQPYSAQTSFTEVFLNLIYRFFYYTRLTEASREICDVAQIDELHKVLRTFLSGPGEGMISLIPLYRYKDNEPIVALAVEQNLHSFVREKLSLHPQLVSMSGNWTLLDHAIAFPSLGFGYRDLFTIEFLDIEMITLLLSNGVPPNKRDPESHRSTWERFLKDYHERKLINYQQIPSRVVVEIMKLFIQYGADLNVEVASDTNYKTHETRGRWGRRRTIKLPVPFKDILEANFTPSEVAEIMKVVEEKNKFSLWKWIGWE